MRTLAITILALATIGCQVSKTFSTKQMGSSSHAGIAYEQSFLVAQNCRDLTDQEIEEAEDMPGGGYSDSVWTGENPEDCIGIQQTFECDDGDIIILLDDGELLIACEWPEEYPGSDDAGSAYREAQVAPECFDCE